LISIAKVTAFPGKAINPFKAPVISKRKTCHNLAAKLVSAAVAAQPLPHQCDTGCALASDWQSAAI